MKQNYTVTGMTCSACSAHVTKSVQKLEGVIEVSVNLLKNSMVVTYDENKLKDIDVIRAVESGGYGASVASQTMYGNSALSSGSGKISSGSEKEKISDSVAKETQQMKKRLLLSVIFLIPLMYLSMGHMVGLPLPGFLSGMEHAVSFAFTQLLLVLPVMYVNRKFYINGFKTLFKLAPNMDSLIAIGSSAAFIYGIFAIYRMSHGLGVGDIALVHQYYHDLYFESVSMILTLITVGKFLESRSKRKTTGAIEKLMDLSPKTALVLRDGVETVLPTEELVIGDLMLIKPGAAIPADGIVVKGNSSVDESALTGESIAVEKTVGSKVFGATINKGGYLEAEAVKVGSDTTLAQIIRLVDEASSSKAPISKLADKIAGIFVPTVISIAVLAVIVWLLCGATAEFALSIGISVLVISCPCALGLATPTAIMVGTGKGASLGILIKSAESLEIAHHVKTVVLDKTGTITTGKPVVTDILTYKTSDGTLYAPDDLLHLAASLEKASEHPLADAIVASFLGEEEAPAKTLFSTADFKAIAGEGIQGTINGQTYFAGNEKMMRNHSVSFTGRALEDSQTFAQEGKTPLFFASPKEVLGVIAVADTIKPSSHQAIEEFKAMGLDVVMLTGDNEITAKAIQKKCGISHVIAGILPQEKEAHIRKLQEGEKKVAMIGDGINDAPALARADVGIAIGAGTDIAIESADIVLIKNDLLDAVAALQLSKATIKNIKQNLFWAFFYNSLGIPLAAGVFYSLLMWKLNPMFGAAAMSCSSIFVVSNALRLRFFKPKYVRNNLNIDDDLNVDNNLNIDDNRNINGMINSSKKENEKMTKTIEIQGMMCKHCQAHVEKALNALEGANAVVDLEAGTATVTMENEIADDVLAKAVTDAGYEVVKIY